MPDIWAGYLDGISGIEILNRMCEQAAKFGSYVTDAHIDAIRRSDESIFFRRGAWRKLERLSSSSNQGPRMNDKSHNIAVERGLLCCCPACDDNKIIDRQIGVIDTRTSELK